MTKFKAGDIIKVPYGDRIIEAIVIDPNGLAQGQPSIGMGFRKTHKHVGIPHSTLSRWVVQIDGVNRLKLPSGKSFGVVQIDGSDGNQYAVVEVCDWMALASDLVKHPGKTRKQTVNQVVDFMAWFAVNGFYAEAYVMLNLVYGQRTQKALFKWKQERGLGIPVRKEYASYIASKGKIHEIGKWTNIIYAGLFGHIAKSMIKIWDTQAGSKNIARNHIPKDIGLKAVAYCERLVVMLDYDDLKETHKAAILIARKKFQLNMDNDVAA